MNIFISWSGDKSRAAATVLRNWIKCILQASCPWSSHHDLSRGSIWFTDILQELNQAKAGVVCLTKENVSKPWILFEAGALVKGLTKPRVCTVLVDLTNGEVEDPLGQFNASEFNQAGFYQLMKTLNQCLDEKALPESVLQTTLDVYWPHVHKDFEEIKKLPVNAPPKPEKSERELLSLVLTGMRSIEQRVARLEPTLSDAASYTDRLQDHLQAAFHTRSTRVFDVAKNMAERGASEADLRKYFSSLGVSAKAVNETLASLYSSTVPDAVRTE